MSKSESSSEYEEDENEENDQENNIPDIIHPEELLMVDEEILN